MPIHPQYIMDHLGSMRTKDGEPLLCFILRRPSIPVDILDQLLEIGLPMYEATIEIMREEFHSIMILKDD